MKPNRRLILFLTSFLLIFTIGITIQVVAQTLADLRANNTSRLVVDANNNGLADGGDVIEYTVNVANCSPNGISGMTYQSDIDPNTSLIPNSVQVTVQGTGLCGSGTVDNPPPPLPTPTPLPINPVVTTTTPADNATEVALDSTITITFSEDVVVVGDWFEMVCTTSGTFNISSANITVTGGPATFILDPNIDLQVGETCVVTVFASSVTDNQALNPLVDYVFDFTAETPPTVTTTTPTNGATTVLNSADILITFDEPVTFTAASFTLECPAGTPFGGGFAVTGSGTNVATINPTGNLPSGTTCEVTVIASQTFDLDANDPPDLLDGNGDDVEGDDFVFSFTTDVDAAPTVITVDPADGATDVPNSTNITITFSELVNINGAGDFFLECGGSPQGYTIITPVTLPASTITVVIDPTVPLPDANTCAVTVLSSVTDTDADDPPDNMAANFVSSFTTEAPPSVTTTTPNNGATGVPTGANIVVNFDEPVDVTTASFDIECPIGNPPFAYSIAGSGTNSITLDPTINLPANQTCTVTVVALQVSDVDTIDAPDNMVANYIFTFNTIADLAPVASSPLDGLTGVATSTNIVINFNEPVDVTAGAFDVTCLPAIPIGFTTIPALPTSNQTSITLDPIANLPATTTCTVSVFAANVTDTDTDEPPNNMAANYLFSFDTVVDAAPTVNQAGIVPSSTTGGPNSASLINTVSTTPTITIPFSEAVDVTAGAFALVCNASSVGITVTPTLPAVGVTSFDISPSVTLTEGANCVLTVNQANVTDADTDDPPNFLVNSFTLSFAVDTAPAETLTETEVGNTFQNVTGAGAVNVDLDSNIQITFTEAVTVTFPANGLQCPGGINIPVTVTTNNATTIVLNPDVNLPLNTLCVLNIPAANISDVDTADAPNNPVAGVNHTFTTVDDDAPTVTTNPAAGGSNIAVNSNISVTFNEPVTLTGAWFELDCTISGVRTSTGELTGTGINIIENTPDLVYTIDPTVDLATGDTCTITIDSANVVDNDPIDPPNELDGDASGDVNDADADDYVAVFSTADTPPQVLSTTPTGVNPTVGANQTVTLNFTEAVNIAAGAFTFECPAGSPITGGFNTSIPLPASAVTTITLTPVNPLPFGTNCVVTAISSLVVDSDPIDPPNFLDGDSSGDLIDDADNFVLNFTVDAQPTLTLPSIQVEIANVLSPASSAVNVDLDTNIVLTFSEPVNVGLTSFDLECPATTDIAFTVSGSGTATITIDPTPATLPINTLCDLDIIAANITDVDANDPPDTLPADINLTFTTVNDNPPSVTTAEAEVGSVFTALSFTPPTYADPDTDLRITFSEAVTVTGNWAQLNCGVSGIQDVTGGLAVTDADPVYTLNPATNLTPGENCTLTIFAIQVDDDDAIDPPTNMLANAVYTFTVQDTPPRVDTLTSTPIDGATVPNTQTVTINFTELVDIAAGGITWTCNAVAVPFTPALPQNNVTSITLTPSGALTNGAGCTVTLESTLIVDDDAIDPPSQLDGALPNDSVDGDADNFVLNFTVDTPPSVTNNVPANGAVDVPVSNNIVIDFSETVNIAAGGITLDCGAGAVPFTPVLPIGPVNTININPNSDLPGGVICTVTVLASGVTDSDAFDPPNQLDGDNNGVEGDNFVFSFTTQQIAIDDTYTVTPHLTYTSSVATLSVRDNDNPTTVTITSFGPSLPTSTVPNGTTVGVSNFITITGAGRVYMNPDGTFVFYPDAGVATGTFSFFYTIAGGDTAEVELTFSGQELVWFVDNTPTSPVCIGTNVGTQACPSADLATVAGVDTDNDTIFIADGAYTCPITLQAGENIIGDGSSLGIASVSGVTPVVGSAFPALSGTDPILSGTAVDCITLATNNDLYGFTIGNTGNFVGIVGTNFGLLTVDDVTINGTGQTVLLNNGTLDVTFNSLSSTSCDGSSSGIQIRDVTAGTFDVVGGVNIANCTVNAISFFNNVMTANLGNVTLSNGLFGLNSANGGTIIANTTNISGTTDAAINIANHPATKPVTFGATTVTKSAAGAVIFLGGNVSNQAAAITFASLDATNTVSDAIFINNQTGTVTVTNAASSNITSVGGYALLVQHSLGGTTPLAMNFTATNASLGSGGIVLNNTSGILNAGVGALNTSGNVVGVFDSTVNLTYNGNVTSNAVGYAVNIDGLTAPGSATFNGIVTASNVSNGVSIQSSTRPVTFNILTLGTNLARFSFTPISLFNNTGAVALGDVSIFTNNANGLVINYVNPTPGLVSSTGGTISTIVGGIALSVNHSTNQPLNLTLTSISSTGGGFHGISINRASGSLTVTNIVEMSGKTTSGVLISNSSLATSFDELDITSSNLGVSLSTNTGSFTIVGDGNTAINTDGAGGTIANMTNEAFSLSNVTNITLNDMIINNTGSHGIAGVSVNGLVLDNVDMTNIGNNDNEYALNFTTGAGANLIGTVVLDNVTINNVADHMVYIENFTGALTLTVTNSIFEDTISTTACGGGNCNGMGLLLRADGTSSMDIVINGNQFNRIDGVGISANPEGNSGAVMEIDILNNSFAAAVYAGPSHTNNGETAISLRNQQGNSVMRFDVNNNIISNYTGELTLGVIEVEAGDFTLSNGSIRNNTINHAHDGNGILIFVDGANTTGSGTTSAVLNVNVSGNLIPENAPIFGASLLANNNGAISGSTSVLNMIATGNRFLEEATGSSRRTLTVNVRDFNNVCMDIRSNELAAGTGGTQPSINLSYNGSGTVLLQGMTGTGDVNAIGYLGANNMLAVAAISGPNNNITSPSPITTCPTPSYAYP